MSRNTQEIGQLLWLATMNTVEAHKILHDSIGNGLSEEDAHRVDALLDWANGYREAAVRLLA